MRILIVLPRFPYPLEKGDKLRAYHQIVELSKQNDVYLFCVTHQSVTPAQIEALQPFCREIRVEKVNKAVAALNVVRHYFLAKSLQMGYWCTKRAKRNCRTYVNKVQPDVIFSQMVRTMPLVARARYPKVMDFQDALSMNMERRMEKSRWPMKALLHYEFKMLRSSEYNAFKIFDRLAIISEVDRDAIPHRNGGNIRIIRNGVDTDFFSPTEGVVDKRYDVVFCGNMQYAPNVDAATFLVEEVMPLVWQSHPDAMVCLAGATPNGSVRKLSSEHVVVTGTVEDIRPYYSQARMIVAPMRIGSGLQNKLLEAMAMGTPCVTTSLANGALGAKNERHLLIGDTPQQLAECICRLIESEVLCKSLSQQALSFVSENFSWQAAGRELEQLLAEATDVHKKNGE